MANQAILPSLTRYSYLRPVPELEISLWQSLKSNIRATFFPEEQPPLRLTSRPVRVREIWGSYGFQKRSAVGTIFIHSLFLGGIVALSLWPISKAQEQPVTHEVVTLTTPDISVYQPVLKPEELSGGGGGGNGGGIYKAGVGGVSSPRILYKPDPEYTEEARKAKYQGVCVLWLVVGPDGTPHDVRVSRALGMGLDQKAIEAVRQWKFEPARKDGKPVSVMVNVEVNFRLY